MKEEGRERGRKGEEGRKGHEALPEGLGKDFPEVVPCELVLKDE